MDLKLFGNIFIAAILVESIWETIRIILDAAITDKKTFIAKIGSLVIGLLVAFNYGLDLSKLTGLTNHIPYLGITITGVLISRGSQFTHDLIKNIENNNIFIKQNKILEVNNKDLNIENKDLTDLHQQLKR